ncbi:MAG: KaiC/GvpD/RAD55 family RecA-like ATPase [Colwellia polaris]|jgi:KaiC/GvpD/RAD55 family RecA-like ATPase
MPDRLSTGIDNLDDMLEGGIPANSTVIIMGDKGTGKGPLVNKLMQQGLNEDQEGLYLTLDGSPDDVVEDADYYGWDFSEYKDDQLVFIDGYSWQAGGSDSMYALDGLSDMNQMNMTFTDAMNALGDERKRVVVNSASTLLLYTDSQSTVKLLQVIGAKSSASGGALFITIEESTHDEQTLSTINHVADGVIKLKMDGDDKKISVSRMDKTDHTRDWKTMTVDKDAGEIDIEE